MNIVVVTKRKWDLKKGAQKSWRDLDPWNLSKKKRGRTVRMKNKLPMVICFLFGRRKKKGGRYVLCFCIVGWS